MRAKSVNEKLDFERGKDPKKSMGIGISDYHDYVRIKLHEKYPDDDQEDLIDRFWEFFYSGYSEERPESVAEFMLSVLEHTPLDYQIEWIQGDLEDFEEIMNDQENIDESYEG
jgi:hypothetical protein